MLRSTLQGRYRRGQVGTTETDRGRVPSARPHRITPLAAGARRALRSLPLLALCAACGGGGDGGTADPDPPGSGNSEWTSGSRLRAVVERGGADAQIFVAWHDTELGADCSWRHLNDGTYRCVPSAPSNDALFYGDPQCTRRVYQHPACSDPPMAIADPAANEGRCAAPRVYRVGAEIAPPAKAYYHDGTSCRSIGRPEAPTFKFYALDGTIDPEELVSATLGQEPRGEHLVAEVFRGSDGTIDARAIADPARGWHCDLTDPGSTHCTPQLMGYEYSYYSDSACTSRLGYFPDQMSRQPFCDDAPGALAEEDLVDDRRVLHEIGAAYTGAVYLKAGQSCSIEPPQAHPPFLFFQFGPLLDLSTLASVAPVTQGSERIRAVVLTAEGGARLRGVALVDQERGEQCDPALAADGTRRCVPIVTHRSSYYVDAACTQAVVAVPRGAPAPRLSRSDDTGYCDAPSRFFGFGAAPSAVTALYEREDDECEPAGGPDPSLDYYVSTGELAASTFAPIARERE